VNKTRRVVLLGVGAVVALGVSLFAAAVGGLGGALGARSRAPG
jgi:hypothetical protein